MIHALLQFALAALIIIGAGIVLTKSADQLAEETGWGRALVGSILLAGATSLPELMVDINAIWLNQPDLAVGDLLGSSLFNLFILAAVDSYYRHPRRAFSSEFIHHAQAAALSINLTALVGVGILAQLPIAVANAGLFTWIVAIVYLIGMKLTYTAPAFSLKKTKQWRLREFLDRRSFLKALLSFSSCSGIILITAPYMVRAADEIAKLSGLGHTFVGTTLVALSTSLPELVATIAAFAMGAPDLALGNIFGSNTFNMVLFFPLDLLFQNTLFSSVRPTHALTAFCVITVGSVAIMGQLSRKREKTRMWEPSSELIVLLTIAFFYLLYRVRN
jgi:cation:H+ antiporter